MHYVIRGKLATFVFNLIICNLCCYDGILLLVLLFKSILAPILPYYGHKNITGPF